MKKQARMEQDRKGRKLQLHKETLQKLVHGGDDGGTVTHYTCPDTTGPVGGICVS